MNKKDINLNLLVVDPDTGEHLDVDATMRFNKHYTVRKLNMRMNNMRLRDVQIELCISKSATQLFWVIVDSIDVNNQVIGISSIARNNEVDLRRLQKMLKSMKDLQFIKSVDRGIYTVNPFIIVGKAVRRNESISELQSQWEVM